ncbi:MAG TPA: LysR family transcriptional regulator [Methylophilaceae bacterium]
MVKISLEAIEILDAIDRRGSFAAAAEELFRVPSAITYSVQKLEQDIGVALFDRSGHRAELTDAGKELLREGRQLLRAAGDLESHVKRVSTGCEAELRIAISDLFSISRFYSLVEEFYRQGYGTRVQLLREVYGGSWDVLVSGRADISFGTPGEGPSGGGYNTHLLGMMDFVFAVAPHHPLAEATEPLQVEDILKHRAVAAADSSRNLPPRTSGILIGQDVFTVPDIQAKLDAQIHGLGVGYLPKMLAMRHAEVGHLVIKQVAEPKPSAPFYLAWRTQRPGKAMRWFIEHMQRMPIE